MTLPNVYVFWTNKNSDTLISCFPTREPLHKENVPYPHDLDVMASATTFEDLQNCQDIVDLLALLAHRSIDRMFDESNSRFVDMLSIYRWAAANKVCGLLNIFARHRALQSTFG